MPRMIIVSLPVSNLEASIAFYNALGFKNNAACTDETAASMIWSEAIQIMLLTHAKWRTFTTRPISPVGSSHAMMSLTCEDRATVDSMNAAAAAHGGKSDINPVEDHGFMYGRDFSDPDGHAWGAMYFDSSTLPLDGQ